MAGRDYKKEYALQKSQRKIVGVFLENYLIEKFNDKLIADGTNKNAFLNACIRAYLDGDISIDKFSFYM